MVSYSDFTVKSLFLENFFPDDFTYQTNPDEFALAVGLMEGQGIYPNEFAEYGQFQIGYREWDVSVEKQDFIPMKTRACRVDDFSGDPEQPTARFNLASK